MATLEDTAPVEAAEESEESTSAQPKGDQEAAQATDEWESIRSAYRPEQITEAIKAQQLVQRIEDAGGFDAIVTDRATEASKQQLAKLRESPQGRALLAKWAGVAHSEEDIPEEERRYRALEAKIEELNSKLADKDEDQIQTKEEVLTLATSNRLEREMNELYDDHPEFLRYHRLMWPNLMQIVDMNPRVAGKPGWVKAAAKDWVQFAEQVRKIDTQPKARPRISQGQMATRPMKNPEDMTEEEARAYAHSLLEE
jgi:hypothetical protein